MKQMKAEGNGRRTMGSHTRLWKKLDAKNPATAYGAVEVGKTRRWHETGSIGCARKISSPQSSIAGRELFKSWMKS